jgi:riboflavin kinase/FMN adenylyltransferase
LLKECGVDHVVVVPFDRTFSQLSAAEYVSDFLVKNFQPKVIVIGYDHHFGQGREGNIDFLKKMAPHYAFEVLEIPAQQVDEIAVSSSKIRKALEISDIKQANRLLGHSFSISGEVVHGNHLGRTIGFPTANIALPSAHKLLPPNGIYAAQVRHGGHLYDAMLYIGHRPSIPDAKGRVVEVNLLNFEGDLYGQHLTVEVLDFIRPDKKLNSMEGLRDQISADKNAIIQRLAMHKMENTPVGIVILNYNTRRHLEQYLPSVLAHSPGAKIIVADNGSPDDSIAFLQQHYPQVEVLDLHRNYGFAQGYNEALQRIKAAFSGGIYVILNSDVEVAPGWMEPVLAAMHADPNMAIAQPKILAWRDKTRFEYAGASGGWIDNLGYPFCRGRIFSHSEVDAGQYDTPQECFWAAGAAFFIRADLYHQFGGFDGDYFAHNEEIDLCWRIKRAGYGVWCIPQSVVYHLGGGTLEYENPRKVYLNFRNSLFTLIKNESVAKLCWLIPARLMLDGVAAARFAAKGQFRAILAIARGHFSLYRQFGETLRKRRAITQMIQKHGIGPTNRAGIYRGSIISMPQVFD